MRSLNVPIFILTAATAASAHAGITSNWIGSSGGVWSSGANWSSGVPGTGGVTDAVITTGRGLITVNLDSFPVIQTLTIGSGCTLLQPDNRDLTVTGVLNDGFWSLSSAGSSTDIILNANMAFLGSGTIELGNSSANRILSVGAVRTLLNGANHTIRGAGQVGFNNTQITNDVAMALRTPTPEAEEIKLRHGIAKQVLADPNDKMEVPGIGDRGPRALSRQALAEVIEPRVEELYSLVHQVIRESGYEELLSSGVVLTGGTAVMPGMVELGEDIFLKPVRRGVPKYANALSDMVAQPRASTVMGLLEEARTARMRGLKVAQKNGSMKTAFGQVKDWFVGNF